MDNLQRYHITLVNGQTVTGFVTTVSVNGVYVLDVFAKAHRTITAYDRADYISDNPRKYSIGYRDHIGRFTNPVSLIPHGKPCTESDLPFALHETGSWFRDVKVPYIKLRIRGKE